MKYSSYQRYLNFIEKYKIAINASSGSEVDPNANVESKNITTLTGELFKREAIGTNRLLMVQKIFELYGEELAVEYIRQLEDHEIYKHDETSLMPYTYAAQESVVVENNDITQLVSFKKLYDIINCKESLLDVENEVYAKYPENLYVNDRSGKTRITRVVKKRRHRDLVEIKTQYGEDIIVTDNHPLIVSNDKNDTIEAVNSLNYLQYRSNNTIKLKGKTTLPFINVEDYGSYTIRRNKKSVDYLGKEIICNEKFGYFIGFFIAEGWFAKNSEGEYTTILIKQKEKNTLLKCADYLHEATGIKGIITPNPDSREFFTLRVANTVLVELMMDTFGLTTNATQKTMPINTFELNDRFIRGMLSGLIDGDGTVNNSGQISIRLSSRAAVSQLSSVLSYLNLGSSMMYQDTSGNMNSLIKSNFPLFGITFYASTEDLPFCEKVSKKSSKQVRYENYENEVWSKIINVKKISNESFLQDNEFIYDITTESNTFVLNNLWVHNCVSITMYPFLFKGLNSIGGISNAPTNLDSFCGSFINLVFAIASQFAGAVSTPEFLTYMDYFIRKEYGEKYYLGSNKIVDLSSKKRSIDKIITDRFEQVTYSLNQPAAARNFQSVFWNIAYFDKFYFNGLFEDFVFPDGSEPNWDSINWLQQRYMKWLNDERLKKVITFPVETVNLLDDGKDYVDEEWKEFTATMYSEGHSFFTYRSDSVDSLASCCRLRNAITENTFSYTLGAGGISTGSKGVITINVNRLIQNAVREGIDVLKKMDDQAKKNIKYLTAYNEIVKDNFKAKLLPIYDAGFISLDKQYLTTGINGFIEGAEFLEIDISPNEDYFHYGEHVLRPIYEENKKSKTNELMFNTEFVPGENLGVKNAAWDKKDGYVVNRDCYNSYFYKSEDETCNIIDKFILHGDRLTKYLDGGSALHANLSEHLSKEQYLILMKTAIKTGCSYFTFNIPNTICDDCGYISKQKTTRCQSCGSENVDYITRIIGYLKRVSKFSEDRQREELKRYYAES